MQLNDALNGLRADLVLSDMAPNISGTKAVDQPRAMHLAELALDLCGTVLKPGGDLVCKLFQGQGSRRNHRRRPAGISAGSGSTKPDASRTGSREVYLVARNHQLCSVSYGLDCV